MMRHACRKIPKISVELVLNARNNVSPDMANGRDDRIKSEVMRASYHINLCGQTSIHDEDL